MARKKAQAYTEEFRREAVKRSEKEGTTTVSVARDLGISPQQIYNWRRQFTRLSEKQSNTVDGVLNYAQSKSGCKFQEPNEILMKSTKRVQEHCDRYRAICQPREGIIDTFFHQYDKRKKTWSRKAAPDVAGDI